MNKLFFALSACLLHFDSHISISEQAMVCQLPVRELLCLTCVVDSGADVDTGMFAGVSADMEAVSIADVDSGEGAGVSGNMGLCCWC